MCFSRLYICEPNLSRTIEENEQTMNQYRNTDSSVSTFKDVFREFCDAGDEGCDYIDGLRKVRQEPKTTTLKDVKGTTQTMFNRLSRARRVAENAFSIASSVFGVLRKPMLLESKKMLIVMCVILLHNYLRTYLINLYIPSHILNNDQNKVLIEEFRRNTEEITSIPLRHTPPQDLTVKK